MKQTLLSLLLFFCFQNLMGQSTSISGGYGIAQYANTDEYISESRYSGVASLFSTQLERAKDKRVFRFGFQLMQGDEIKNSNQDNLSAEILDFRLNVNHLFQIPSLSIGSKEINIWMGPGYSLSAYERKQNVATGGRLESKLSSYFIQIPVEYNALFSIPIASKLEVIGDFSFNLISMGIRSDLDDDFDAKALLFYQNLNSSLDLKLVYRPIDPIGIYASWNNNYSRLTGFDQGLYAGNSGVNIGLILKLSKNN